MKRKRTGRQPALLKMVMVALFVVLLIVWGMTALAVGDERWFLPVFSADAASFDLYWDGEVARLEEGSDGYVLLNEALHQDLARVQSYSNMSGLSEETLDTLKAEGRLLVARYDEPARIHSWYAFGASKILYIPLSGYHTSQDRVFNAARGAPLEMRSLDRVRDAAETVAQQEGLE